MVKVQYLLFLLYLGFFVVTWSHVTLFVMQKSVCAFNSLLQNRACAYSRLWDCAIDAALRTWLISDDPSSFLPHSPPP